MSDPSVDRLASAAVFEFLKDAHVVALFKSPSKAFEAPSAQTKVDFETKTAAIHVTPTPNGRYDIKEIKEDVLWLSKSVKINEVAALRVVVVEVQDRPRFHLASPLSNQDVVNIRGAVGGSSAATTNAIAALDTSSNLDADTILSELDKPSTRRQRILATYFSERRHFTMFADLLTSFLLQGTTNDAAAPSPVAGLRRETISAISKGAPGPYADTGKVLTELLPAYLDFVVGRLAKAQENVGEALESENLASVDWDAESTRTCLTEIIHGTALIYQLLWNKKDSFVPHIVAARWFQFMDDCLFFDALPSVSDLGGRHDE